MVLYAKPPNPKWGIGLKAAQMWQDYCEKDSSSEKGHLLIPLIKFFMPVSHSGSVFLDLWLRILIQVAKIPVSEQKEIWLEVFNAENQGETKIKGNDVALKILEEWTELDNLAKSSPIKKSIMIDMAAKVRPYAFSSDEWIRFTFAMSAWFERHIEEPSFLDALGNKFENKHN